MSTPVFFIWEFPRGTRKKRQWSLTLFLTFFLGLTLFQYQHQLCIVVRMVRRFFFLSRTRMVKQLIHFVLNIVHVVRLLFP